MDNEEIMQSLITAYKYVRAGNKGKDTSAYQADSFIKKLNSYLQVAHPKSELRLVLSIDGEQHDIDLSKIINSTEQGEKKKDNEEEKVN